MSVTPSISSFHGKAMVVILDEWHALAAPVRVSWQWLTRAQIQIEGHRATLRQNGQTLSLHALATTDVAFAVEDVSRPQQAHDVENPNLSRLTLVQNTPAHGFGQFCVYHQSLVYKIAVSRKQPELPCLSPEDALQIIEKVAQMTRGLKQIVYLVGWQFEGHDSKYPSWSQVNERFKREEDATARDSLLWLMDAAKEFNCVVSLHINMDDAYPNSPLWDLYLEHNLIRTDENGAPKEAGVWDGEMSYHVFKCRKWNSGLAQQRIDDLLDYLPPLRETGTIHIDAFRPQPIAKHESETFEDEMEAAQQILLYWREKGLDVTTEFLSYHELAGLLPLAWHLNGDESTRLQYPASVLCGGASNWNQRNARLHRFPAWTGNFACPEAGCKYEEAWGHASAVDVLSVQGVEKLVAPFAHKVGPWYLLNREVPVRHTHTATDYGVEFSGGTQTNVRISDRYLTVQYRGELIVDGGDGCVPALWRDKENGPCELIAWSQHGGRHEWKVPVDWKDVSNAEITPVSPFAPEKTPRVAVKTGWPHCTFSIEWS